MKTAKKNRKISVLCRDMNAKIGKAFIYLQIAAILVIGILDDVDISLYAVYAYVKQFDLILLVWMLFSDRKRKLARGKHILGLFALWLCFQVVNGLFHGVSEAGVRYFVSQWCFGPVFFAGCLMFLDREDGQRIYSLAKLWYVANFLLMLVEFLFLDKGGDMLGGFFGCYLGSNREMNLMLCIFTAAALCEMYSAGKLLPVPAFILLSAMVLGALTEIKAFYLEYPLILTVVTLLSWKYLDKTLVKKIAGMALGVMALALLLISLTHPKDFQVLVGMKSYSRYEETSRKTYLISRLGFFREINEIWFHGEPLAVLTGFGPGNCADGTPFFAEFGYYNYLYFAHQQLLLEGGLISLGLFVLIFVVAALNFGWQAWTAKEFRPELAYGAAFALMLGFNVFYNNAASSYAVFLWWGGLAMALVFGLKEEVDYASD